MEEFLQKFGTIEGIVDILQHIDADGILSITADIFEKNKSDIENTEIECLGADGNRETYSNALQKLSSAAPFILPLYNDLDEGGSKEALLSILKYWLIPDPEFLRVDFKKCYNSKIVVHGADGIINNTEEITQMKGSDVLSIIIDNALTDLFLSHKLNSLVRDDLSYTLQKAGLNEIILHAFPKITKMEKLKRRSQKLRVACVAKDHDGWRNEELLKDKGLIPFFLHNAFGYDSKMVGKDNGEYPYLSDYLNGLEIEFLPDGEPVSKCNWVEDNAENIDILVVNGLYPVNMDIMRIYQRKRPEGIIYLALDANADWMDRILHKNEFFYETISNVDIIGSSGRRIQRHLNEKWPWPVEYFPNGFFHPWIQIDRVEYKDKENTILTVGRLGTEQKATNIMLEAFAKAAGSIPEWKLKLVGSMEPSFEGYVESFYNTHPDLRDRVIFTGKIENKVRLFEEYKKAKIFTLTSILEGGTPNVIAEALHSGCAIAVTEFDAYDDAIANGKCGMSAPIDDTDKVAQMYRRMCSGEEMLRDMCEYAFEYAEEYFSMEKIVRRLNESMAEVV